MSGWWSIGSPARKFAGSKMPTTHGGTRPSTTGATMDDTELENAASESLKAPTPPYMPKPNGASTELTRLNTTIETLYQQKRQQMTDLQARHNRERVDTENEYARMMDDLQHRASEAFRLLAERHEAERQPLQDLLNRVGAMRG